MTPRDPLLQRMLDDMVEASPLYRPTRFWDCGLPDVIEDLEREGIESFRRHPNALNYFVPNFGDAVWFKKRDQVQEILKALEGLNIGIDKLWLEYVNGTTEATGDYRAYRASDDRSRPPDLTAVSESHFGKPLQQFVFDGQCVSQSMLNYMRMLTLLKRTVDTRSIERVLEIGGGFGSLGEILLKASGSDYFYVDVDIPPTGFVATRYLQEVFGADAVASYEVTRELEAIDLDDLAARYRAAVLCPWQLPRVEGRFQLFVNSISFQEMEPHVVRNYAEHVDRLVESFLLLRNSRHGKPVAKEEGVPGVETPLKRDDYIEIFSAFEVLAIDAFVHGRMLPGGFASEVMVLGRAG